MASNPIEHENIKVNLKTYNNILRKNIRAAKVHFYHSQFDKLKKISKTWSAINNLLNRNNTKNHPYLTILLITIIPLLIPLILPTDLMISLQTLVLILQMKLFMRAKRNIPII